MIPTIDILFQLVIFFMLACQFAVVEQFPIPVPDQCAYANTQKPEQIAVTVTMTENPDGGIELAVGPEKVTVLSGKEMSGEIKSLIDDSIPPAATKGTVCLRIAKNTPFEQYKRVLEGVAASRATDVQMSVLKETDPGQLKRPRIYSKP